MILVVGTFALLWFVMAAISLCPLRSRPSSEQAENR